MAKEPFKLYDIKLRLGGSRDNEVRRFAETAPAVMLFRAIHKDDSLSEIKEIDPANVEDDDTRERLESIRQRGDAAEREALFDLFEAGNPGRTGIVTATFGPAAVPLPRGVPEAFGARPAAQPAPPATANAKNPKADKLQAELDKAKAEIAALAAEIAAKAGADAKTSVL